METSRDRLLANDLIAADDQFWRVSDSVDRLLALPMNVSIEDVRLHGEGAYKHLEDRDEIIGTLLAAMESLNCGHGVDNLDDLLLAGANAVARG